MVEEGRGSKGCFLLAWVCRVEIRFIGVDGSYSLFFLVKERRVKVCDYTESIAKVFWVCRSKAEKEIIVDERYWCWSWLLVFLVVVCRPWDCFGRMGERLCGGAGFFGEGQMVDELLGGEGLVKNWEKTSASLHITSLPVFGSVRGCVDECPPRGIKGWSTSPPLSQIWDVLCWNPGAENIGSRS